MKRKIETAKRYLDVLSADTGWQIIIEDYYGLLRPFKVIENYLSDKNWHTNPYCLAIKKNRRLWKRCVSLKRATRRSIRKRAKPGWSVCYCGVAEYTVPVFASGVHVATVCVAGFTAEISKKMVKILAGRIKMTEEEFLQLRQSCLRADSQKDETKLSGYILPVAEVIEELAKSSPLIKAEGGRQSLDSKQTYVLRAIDHIEKHFSENITPESVANRCHLSPSYLQHLFLKYTGEGIASVIRRKRLEGACRLLAETGRSVRDIAISCGFYDTDYFSVVFKRTYRVSPLAFRKGKAD